VSDTNIGSSAGTAIELGDLVGPSLGVNRTSVIRPCSIPGLAS